MVLREDVLSHSNDILNHLVTHELLHILTRANNNFRKEMYEIIGFKLIEPIDYPESLKAFRITNPEATQTDSYIQLEVQGESVEYMMILYSKLAYLDGDFFNYLNVGFLSLTGNEKRSIMYFNGQPVIYPISEVNRFFEQVEENTGYILHP